MDPIHKKYERKSISVKTTSPLSDKDLRDLIEFRSRGMNDPSFEMLIHNELTRLVTASETITQIEELLNNNGTLEDIRKIIFQK